jgi:hypothetical protein
MSRLICAICIALVTLPAFCEPAAKYEVATIMDVKPHQSSADSPSAVARYDISVKVGGTVYVVLYTDSLGTSTVKYAAGRELLVYVEKKTVTYNDILGQPHELPIISQKPAAEAKQSK